MVSATSPLRYPGGKNCLFPLVSQILQANKIEGKRYAEPYAGGCGLALSLLFEGYVNEIHINDIDPLIWSFWHSVLNHTDALVDKIRNTPVTIDEWRKQRQINLEQNIDDPVSLGFSTFFLNRTNRSGIIKAAGVIGGISQNGKYKIDCRFNRKTLEERIRRIVQYRDKIYLSRMDALDFIRNTNKELPSSTFLCVDPPYFHKGKGLYTSFYEAEDHRTLAEEILKIENPWIVTYDAVDPIRQLYLSRRQYEFDINYSLATKRQGTELLVASKGLRLPSQLRERQINRPNYRAA